MYKSSATLKLYKQMLRESERFVDFNFRSYAKRRIRGGFKMGKPLSNEAAATQVKLARENLELIKRQTVIGTLFNSGQKLSVEMVKTKN